MAKKKQTIGDDPIAYRDHQLLHLTKEQVLAALDFIDGDGHTIFKEESLIEKCGWSKEAARSVCKVIESSKDGNPKGQIFSTDGRGIYSELYGWYCLDVLRWLARVFGVEWDRSIMGRGFEARAITEALRQHLKEAAHV